MRSKALKYVVATLILLVVVVAAIMIFRPHGTEDKVEGVLNYQGADKTGTEYIARPSGTKSISEANGMPVYGNWKNFTEKDGLPSDKVYSVKIDGDRVLAGTHNGLAVYENNKWTVYTTKDGLAHNGVVSVMS